jgi:hydrogenase nickel incorporation protein HypB
MCTTCGCGTDHVHIDGVGHPLARAAQAPLTGAERFAAVPVAGSGETDSSFGHMGVHAHGTPAARIVQVERDLLAANDSWARLNRDHFAATGTLCLNLVSSPGSGKTTLLVRTVAEIATRRPVSVIEGDQQTSNDADRIRATGVPAVQVNTGKGCHLEAPMVAKALEALPLAGGGVLFVENVGNLVCPALFDLGEAHKVAILSVTEGEDKPLKYPDMFRAADLVLLNKTDLLPFLDFDVDLCEANARRVNPSVEVLRVSARSGEGFDAWLAWIERRVAALHPAAGAGRGEARP